MGNTVDGIIVQQVSQAQISGNTIEANTGSGVAVVEYSGVNLGQSGGTPLFIPANLTTEDNENGEYGVHCRTGGYVKGHLGTLTGDDGNADMETTCIDGIIVP